VWPGYYPIIVAWLTGSLHSIQGALPTPPFAAILNGELWRLITPIFLHANILHLFFNMLWLIILGNQVEWHMGRKKYILLLVVIGAFSNTCQYLMTGSSFMGFSGVVSGLFTFIWLRQKLFAWEGYLLASSTALFLTIFLLGMLGIEAASFVTVIMQSEGLIDFTLPSTGIANTAHISGALLGLLLARLNFFRQKA
jgi:GlpG protein